jgi:hypothetical protein
VTKVYQAHNYAQPTTAAPVPVTTGTAIKTLLQIATPSTEDICVMAWGIDFDGTAAAAPIKVELIDTDTAATVTAHGASGLVKLNGPSDAASVMTLSLPPPASLRPLRARSAPRRDCSSSGRSRRTAAMSTSSHWAASPGWRSRGSSASE